ncbi:class I SAM-dependent methyltransferase [Thioclava sp. FR2]|uniref:class I SAM-dependent methyltransferase n=1 Tax=Thioclava sp. FR2 TaxID=3445780 RepID=UPI003EB73498
MWENSLDLLLRRAIVLGRLQVTFLSRRVETYGPDLEPFARVEITDRRFIPRLFRNPQMALGEGFMDGSLHFPSEADIRHFLQIAATSANGGRMPWPMRLAHRIRVRGKGFMQWNTRKVSKFRVKHHYDIPDSFYGKFLEEDLQYTCAYYAASSFTLEQAQSAKMAMIAKKLCLGPGLRVLDIGCGWGGLALRLARNHGVHVTGVTLSEVQCQAAIKRAKELGLSDKVDFRLQDYRDIPDRFDRVVSVGMMEHVGQPQYPVYFQTIARLLEPDGVGLVHFIGRSTPPGVLSPWFQKYIFPGGYCPAFSEVIPQVEKSGLVMTDLEVWRGHYEQTLRHWQDRFRQAENDVRAMFDERFVRMWWWYLIAAEVSFTHMGHVLFQMQITHDPKTVPSTRDYLYAGQNGGTDARR